MRLSLSRLAALAALLAAAGAIANSAWTSGAPRSQQYVCSSGERFTVDFFSDSIRLRSGTGIFALSAAGSTGDRYSDGHTVFRVEGQAAALERPGLPPADDCR